MCQICVDVFSKKTRSIQYNLYHGGSLKKVIDGGIGPRVDAYIVFDSIVYFVTSISPIFDIAGREVAKAVNLTHIGSFN